MRIPQGRAIALWPPAGADPAIFRPRPCRSYHIYMGITTKESHPSRAAAGKSRSTAREKVRERRRTHDNEPSASLNGRRILSTGKQSYQPPLRYICFRACETARDLIRLECFVRNLLLCRRQDFSPLDECGALILTRLLLRSLKHRNESEFKHGPTLDLCLSMLSSSGYTVFGSSGGLSRKKTPDFSKSLGFQGFF